MNDLLERLKVVISKWSGTPSSFASATGINYKTLDHQLKGERSLNVKTITLTLQAYPDLSAEWLLRGEGDMYRSSKPQQTAIANGSKSVAAINSEVTMGESERVKFLEQLLAEKERTIQILISNKA